MISLFVGFSFLTLVEIIDVICKIFFSFFSNRVESMPNQNWEKRIYNYQAYQEFLKISI